MTIHIFSNSMIEIAFWKISQLTLLWLRQNLWLLQRFRCSAAFFLIMLLWISPMSWN